MINISYNDGHRQCVMVHRMVMETFLDHFNNTENIYEVNHMDGNKNNNSFNNLEWVTRQENLQHARDNKLFKILRGEENGNCKFKDIDVKLMRTMYENKERIIDIAKFFNASRSTVSNIVHRRKR